MGIPLGEWSGSDATNALRQSIERFNTRTAKQTVWLLRLTWAIAVLTLAIFLLTGVLVWTAFREARSGRGQTAGGAWVMWNQSGTQPHVVVSAHPSSSACEAAMADFVSGLRKNGAFVETMGPRLFAWHRTDDSPFATSLCLPDTVDPRGPKGK
jgi:hypothetical protein